VVHSLGRGAALFHNAAKGILAPAGIAGVHEDILGLLPVALGHDFRAASRTQMNRCCLQLFASDPLECLLSDRGRSVFTFGARHDDYVAFVDLLEILHRLYLLHLLELLCPFVLRERGASRPEDHSDGQCEAGAQRSAKEKVASIHELLP
jgi:hypothetical protein